jgi:hypothetical protein
VPPKARCEIAKVVVIKTKLLAKKSDHQGSMADHQITQNSLKAPSTSRLFELVILHAQPDD